MADYNILWHITDNPKWKFDPTYHPIWAYTLPEPTREPGLFVTDRPSYWNPYFGRGPLYVVRLVVPKDVLPRPSEAHPEFFITDFSGVQVTDFVPLAEAIRRGQEETRRGIPWWNAEWGGFGGVEDWWFTCAEVWDDKKMQLVTRCRKRKGLDPLMREWKKAHPGFDNPDEYFRAKYR